MSLSLADRANRFRERFRKAQEEIGKMIVGQPDVIQGVLTCLFVGGHVLLEGVPGLGKTLIVRTLSQVLDLPFARIQFTPDLMPSDILGTNIITETPDGKRDFRFQAGPIFAQIVLADEINRATPKTQSALLEAMQEKQVTVGGQIRKLEEPFFVLATQNPIEQEGTYPLPEAQLDRFLFKLLVPFCSREELAVILDRTTKNETPRVSKIMDSAEIKDHIALVREVLVAAPVQDYAIRLLLATHPGNEFAPPLTSRYLRAGGSPRAAQAMILAAKVNALLAGRFNVSFSDIRQAYLPCLRHRILLNFEAQAENIAADQILTQIQQSVPESTEKNR
jgi:MoxR-like ATPase